MSRIAFLVLMSLTFGAIASAEEHYLTLLFLGDQKNHKPAIRFKILKPVMARKGIELTYTEDVASLNSETLNHYDGLILYANIASINPDQAKALLDYVASGKPVLLMIDPLPAFNIELSPQQQPPNQFQPQPQRTPADLSTVFDELGVEWPSERIIWDKYNPHPQFRSAPRFRPRRRRACPARRDAWLLALFQPRPPRMIRAIRRIVQHGGRPAFSRPLQLVFKPSRLAAEPHAHAGSETVSALLAAAKR